MGNAPCIAKGSGDELDMLRKTNLDLQHELTRAQNGLAPKVANVVGSDCAWLNTIILELWPNISAFVAETVRKTVEPKIKAALPSPLSGSFHFDTVTLGDVPLQFGSITATPEDYVGRSGKVRDINLKLDTIYKGDAHVSLSVAGAQVGIQSIQLEGVLSIVLKELLPHPPFFGGVSVFFANCPSIKMNWTGVTKILCLLKGTIRDIVLQQISNICVLPKRIAVVMDTSEERLFRIKCPRPPGCLHVHLKSARNLEGKDWSVFGKATSDGYVKMRVGGQAEKSSVVKGTCDPQWNEPFSFYVFDKTQTLCMEIYDEDFGSGDDFLGRVELPIHELLGLCNGGSAWLALGPQEGEEGTAQGEVEVKANWSPIELDQVKAKAILSTNPDDADRPQALMFLGVYSVKVPPAKVGTAYTIEASCNGKSFTVGKSSAVPATEASNAAKGVELQDKILKLRTLKASDQDIADILSIPVEALKEKSTDACQYTDEVVVQEPFLWFGDVPKNTDVDITVSEGKTKLGSVKVRGSDILNESNCTIVQTFKDEKVEIQLISQIRVITGPEKNHERFITASE